MEEKDYLKKKKIVNWNIGIHILLCICTWCIWLIFYFKFKKECEEYELKQQNERERLYKEHQENIVVDTYFKVSGVTFENRQELIDSIVKQGIEDGYIEPYGGYSNKEIIDDVEEVNEADEAELDVRLEKTKYENEDAIAVYIKDYRDNEYLIGFVPKRNLADVMDALNIMSNNPNYKLHLESYITGGKIKAKEYDSEEDKEIVIKDEKNYGINVKLKITKK